MDAQETDLEARCRLARECGALEGQLRNAKELIAFLSNERLPRDCRTIRYELDGVRFDLEIEGDELVGVYVCGTPLDLSYFSDDLQDLWRERVANELAEMRADQKATRLPSLLDDLMGRPMDAVRVLGVRA